MPHLSINVPGELTAPPSGVAQTSLRGMSVELQSRPMFVQILSGMVKATSPPRIGRTLAKFAPLRPESGQFWPMWDQSPAEFAPDRADNGRIRRLNHWSASGGLCSITVNFRPTPVERSILGQLRCCRPNSPQTRSSNAGRSRPQLEIESGPNLGRVRPNLTGLTGFPFGSKSKA